MTAYKYVSPDIDAQINWATVGQTIASNFKAEAESREQKKEAIDKATRDMLKTLSVPPQGQDETKSQQAIKYGQDMSSFILSQEKLLKSGQINPKAYMLTIQNAIDSTNQMYDAFQSYQDNYKEIMERSNSNENQPFELFLASKGEQFRDFNLYQPVINADGTVSMAKKIKTKVDGKEVVTISSDPNDIMPVSYINSAFTSRFDRFNAVNSAKTLADGLATYVRSTVKNPTLSGVGLIKEFSSPKNNPKYKEVIDNLARSQMQGLNMLSYLTVDMSVDPTKPKYNIVDNPTDAAKSPYNILVQREGGKWVPKFTKEQEQAALDSFKTSIESYIGSKESVQSLGLKSEESEASVKRKKDYALANEIGFGIGDALTRQDDASANTSMALLTQITKLNWIKGGNQIMVVDPKGEKPTAKINLRDLERAKNNPNLARTILLPIAQDLDYDIRPLMQGFMKGARNYEYNTTSKYQVPLPTTSNPYFQGATPPPPTFNYANPNANTSK